MRTSRAYGDDLAYVHDVAFGEHSRRAAPELLQLMRDHGIEGGRVVDLGCGSGIWARALTDAGYDVLGIDISASMIRLARRRAPRARFRRGAFLDARLPRCVAVTALGECFNYTFDGRGGTSSLARVFASVYRALDSGGLFVFDVAEPGAGRRRGRTRDHFTGDDWAILVEREEDLHRRLLTRRITSFRRVGRSWRRREETHRLRLHRAADLATALRRVGFRARVRRGYGRLRFDPGLAAVLARKP